MLPHELQKFHALCSLRQYIKRNKNHNWHLNMLSVLISIKLRLHTPQAKCYDLVMKQPNKLLKLIALLRKCGYVVAEKKPVNRRGNLVNRNLFIIEPIA